MSKAKFNVGDKIRFDGKTYRVAKRRRFCGVRQAGIFWEGRHILWVNEESCELAYRHPQGKPEMCRCGRQLLRVLIRAKWNAERKGDRP